MTKLKDLVIPVGTWNPAMQAGEGRFTYIDLGSIDQDTKQVVGARVIAHEDAPSRARQLVQTGDILISTVRPNLNGVARVTAELDRATASTGFCVLRPKPSLDSSYLFHWAKTPTFISEMTRKATGQSYPAVSDRIVFESDIPLPPLTEQKRIAEVLDSVDALRSKRRQNIALLDDLAQSVFLDMFGDPVSNTRRWERVKLRKVVTRIDSGWSPVCLDRPARSEEWGVLKLGAVTSCEFKPSENKALPLDSKQREQLEVKVGDLLFSRKNTKELVAACALVKDTPPRLMMSDLIFRLVTTGIDRTYLHSLLTHPAKRFQVQELAGGSAGSMPNISKARLLDFEIEQPPLGLQREFAVRIEAIETEKARHRAHLVVLDELFLAVQSRAFAGTLFG